MSVDMIIFTTHTPNHNPILDLFFCIHISQPTMTSRIHPGDLILRRYPQQFQLMQNKKQSPHRHTNPSRDHHNLHYVRRKQPPSSSHQQPKRSVRITSIDLRHIRFISEQSSKNNPPSATTAVKLSRF
ncbi:hypothetical protein N665_0468s0026 [Sinapis alba]|nr:hypothetical protein N665_0468s0026 [Sinapis alba]